jgi:type I restriction enzyme M protein
MTRNEVESPARLIGLVRFFENGVSTKKVWSCQFDPWRNFHQNNPSNDADLSEFIQLQTTKTDSANSWMIDDADLNRHIWELTVRNPSAERLAELGTPAETVAAPEDLDQEAAVLVAKFKELLK